MDSKVKSSATMGAATSAPSRKPKSGPQYRKVSNTHAKIDYTLPNGVVVKAGESVVMHASEVRMCNMFINGNKHITVEQAR